MNILKTQQGVTLIEMMLVLAVMAALIAMGINYYQQRMEQYRIERTAMQMQQILNAAATYYVAKNDWPKSIKDLQGDWGNFLPLDLKSPYGEDYYGMGYSFEDIPDWKPKINSFFVWTEIKGEQNSGRSLSITTRIANLLPLAYTSWGEGNDKPPAQVDMACYKGVANCKVVARISIPPANLNSARAVNFTGLYRHGGCVPVPTCPVNSATNKAMTPQIMVAPVSVSGLYDLKTTTANNPPVYPITGFTAYSTQSFNYTGKGNANIPLCQALGVFPADRYDCGDIPAGKYWRVCLQVQTQRGSVSNESDQTNIGSNNEWGGKVALMAVTRCAVDGENSGSNFNVFTK